MSDAEKEIIHVADATEGTELMGSMSKRKGKCGELELSKELSRLFGVSCRRGQQFQGSPDSPDVIGIEGLHIECKRAETFNAYAAMAQSVEDAGGKLPCVMHRRNGKDWLVVFRLDDLPDAVVKMFHVLAAKST